MYRCMACDAPASNPCKCAEERTRDFEKAMAQVDPWANWPRDGTGRKLDIQAGVHVMVREGVPQG